MINEKRVRKFCKEDLSKIKNYDKAIADTTQVWDCHHMTETWWNCTRKELIENECYYNRKACELIFLTHSEHARLHKKGEKNPMYGKTHSEETRRKISEAAKNISDETRQKMSEAKKGENNPFFGKHLSEETRQKMSEAKKGRILSDETRRKLSEAKKGRTWKLIDGKRVLFPKEAK